MIARHVRRPQLAHRGDVLIGAAAAILERHPCRVELLLRPADAGAQQHASARHRIERGDLPGADHRIVLRQNQDSGGKADVRRCGGDILHPDQRVGQHEIARPPGNLPSEVYGYGD